MRKRNFYAISGKVVQLIAMKEGGIGKNRCLMLAEIVKADGTPADFVITTGTYVLDNKQIEAGMKMTFWIDRDEPVPLVLPERYRAYAAAENESGKMVDFDYYGRDLVNAHHTLQINCDETVAAVAANNQRYFGRLAGKNLMVVYHRSTRSIPAQTTPDKIVVVR